MGQFSTLERIKHMTERSFQRFKQPLIVACQSRVRYIQRITACLALCGAAVTPAYVMGQGSDGCEVAESPPTSPDSLPHGRLSDSRIGLVTMGPYVCRWHLEARNPGASNSDVVHPIVYLIDKRVPKKWQPYIIKAVQEWLPTFDSIGFHNALTVRVASDTDTLTDPVGVVTIRMTSADDAQALTRCRGRASTGEMLGCRVAIHGGLIKEAGQRMSMYWTGTDPSVPLPLPDSTIGLFLQAIVAHEIGHTLGLDHNFYAPLGYPTDSLRSLSFVRKWGFTPSIMIWGAYDEVAQPQDHIPFAERWMTPGPYDRWALAWAYRPIPNATTPESEKPTLELWRTAQDTATYLRLQENDTQLQSDFGRDWGGDDKIHAIELWVLGKARLFRRLQVKDGTARSPQSMASMSLPDTVRREQDSMIAAGWRRRMGWVTRMIGDTVTQSKQQTVSAARQLQAMRLILGSVLYGQDSLMQQQRSSAHGVPPVSDSVPILFPDDTAAANRSPTYSQWRAAQDRMLKLVGERVPYMPSEAHPEACRYLKDALRALTRAETKATPAMQEEIKELRTSLTYPFTLANGCSGP